ncbi:MAG: glutathione S-transferase family protein [Rhodospirillales bacterium]|nr:glutathione S-transferase family protein [Rhodospirillales bacterium]
MSALTLILGNKNYSSWSMRPWLALAQTGAAYEEIVIPLDRPETAASIAAYSPSGKVPVLRDGELTVWDSLAIIEYLAERFPEAGLWPAAADARAIARSVSAEMHAGFQALRTHMPMNIRAALPGRGRAEGVEADIARVTAIWRDCRSRFGGDGAFLFGAFSAADAMFAPVVTRFQTFAVDLDPVSRAYADAVLNWPIVAAWCKAAADEPWSQARYDDL